MQIVPAILVDSFSKFKIQTEKVKLLNPSYVQLDIMDGVFVNNQSFPEREEVNHLNLPFGLELHLMVNNPLEEIKSWSNVHGLKRIIFHIESLDDPAEVIAKIRELGHEVGIAINPDTAWSKIQPFCGIIDLILFMTVYPGKQGGDFLDFVGNKIKDLKSSLGTDSPVLAIDGGVKPENIDLIRSWSVDIAYVGSALMGAENIQAAYSQLTNL